ncbi:MAG: 4Fe-4S dicluster domain-containing protein [Candidatus Odinarchaeota archaeon]
MDKSVLILGSGITGVTAASSLAQLGHQVYLVEKARTLGGKLLELGFVYPTDDCSLCHESASYCHGFDSHRKCQYRSFIPHLPGLEFLPGSTLVNMDIGGKDNKIKVEIVQETQYIEPSKCIACGACARACPEGGITLSHPQNIPKTYVLDPERCNTSKCKKECLDACKELGAIDLDAKPRSVTINAGAMLVATGFDEKCPPSIDKNYAWSSSDRVVSQLELGKMLDPIKGKKEFLKQEIKNVVIIQCAGSRDQRLKPECSTLCCSYALKHALKLKELDIDVIVAYMDIRTLGVMEEYFNRARKAGIKFIRGHPSSVQIDENGMPRIDLEDTYTSEFKSLKTDLVVLSNPLELVKNDLLQKQAEASNSHVFFLNDELRNIPQSTRAAKSAALEIHQILRG